MAATTIDINVDRKWVRELVGDDAFIAANTTIPLGAMACFNTSGHLVNADGAVAGLVMAGLATRRLVNTTGAPLRVKPAAVLETGVFLLRTSGANALTIADLLRDVYVLDNTTVVKVAGSANSIRAGRLHAFKDTTNPLLGAWVYINP